MLTITSSSELIRLSHVEYWILDMVQEYGECIHGLYSGHYGNNKRFYQYSHHELSAALNRLASQGMIVGYFGQLPVSPDIDDEGSNKLCTFSLSASQIESELKRIDIDYSSWTPEKNHPDPPFLYYRLTPKGGEAWESFARPNWDQFVDGIWYADQRPEAPYQ